MHFIQLRPIIVFLLSLTSFFTMAQGDGWVLKSEKDGIKVYFKKTSDVYEVKLATSIQTSLSGIVHLLDDVGNYPKWGYKVVESTLLKKVNDKEMYYHSKFDFPWPLDDRDIIMHTHLEQDAKTNVIHTYSTAAPTYIPEEKIISV